jgi:Flp pilus assembly protein TadB
MLKFKMTAPAIRRSGLAAICMLAAWLGAVPYVDNHVWQLALALPGGYLIFWSFHKWLKSRRSIFILEQFKFLLEHLLARMSAGATLEKAFIDAPDGLGDLLGKKSLLMASLRQVEQKLLSHQPIDRLLNQIEESLPCPEAAVFLKILPGLRHSGGNVGQFVRQNLCMAVEKISLHQEVGAETTQRRTEAGILALLPFGLTLMLQKSSALFDGNSGADPIFKVGMISAYVLSVAAAALALSAMTPAYGQSPGKIRKSSGKQMTGKFFRLPGRLLQRIYQDMMPETTMVRLTQALQDHKVPDGSDQLQARQIFFERKTLFILSGLMIGTSFMLFLPGQIIWLAIMPVFLSLLQDLQMLSSGRGNRLLYRMEYPVWINLLSALLQAGMSLHNALSVSLDSLQKEWRIWKKPVSSLLNRDLSEIGKQLHLGLPAGWIIEKTSLSCPDPEIQAALLLLARYERTGGQEILDLLQMQSAACWNLYRQAIRKQMEQQSLQLLLPMMLDLISVILTAVLPAWISFRSF